MLQVSVREKTWRYFSVGFCTDGLWVIHGLHKTAVSCN